jgi:hypothetical protein
MLRNETILFGFLHFFCPSLLIPQCFIMGHRIIAAEAAAENVRD